MKELAMAAEAPFREAAYKRPFDLVVVVLAHLFLLPVWIFCWLIIPLLIWWEDRGPVFYRQRRFGKDGKVFTLLKFRTMVPDADRRGPAWNVEGDPRVTRIGQLLRRTALDELPGVLSVWKGDMSLVGPRALPLVEQRFLEERIPVFAKRLTMRPGLTGLAQVYDLADDAQMKLQYDLEYMRGMSLRLDVKLILLSLKKTLLGKWDRRGGKAKATTNL